MPKKVSIKSKIAKRKRYINKLFNEFANNEEQLKKIFGRYKTDTILKNDKAYEIIKNRARESRKITRERKKIHEDYLKYQEKLKNRNKDTDVRHDVIEKLRKQGYSRREIFMLLDSASDVGMNIKNLTKKNFRQRVVAKKVIRDLQYEYELIDKQGKKVKGVFSKYRDEFELQKYFKELEEIIRNDPNSLENTEKALEDFYRKIIPEMYQDWQKRNGEFVTPGNRFRIEMLKRFMDKYKEYIGKNI